MLQGVAALYREAVDPGKDDFREILFHALLG